MILGDLNFNYNINENLHANPIFMIENLFSFKQMVKEPTRVTLSTSSLIDVILSTVPDDHSITGVLKSTLSDHYITYTTLNICHKPRKHREVRFRNYNKFKPEDCLYEFTNAYTNIFDKYAYSMNDSTADMPKKLNEYWEEWKTTFITISDKHAPFKTARLKNRHNRWFTNDLGKMMYERDYLHNVAIKSNDPTKSNELWQNYRKEKNQITSKINKAKK